MPGHDIFLGTTREGNSLYLPEKVRATHMHVLGASGRGKSKFLEHLIREDIRQERGVLLIDPHSFLYDDLVRWIEEKGLFSRRKVILLDPTHDGWTFGFNPLNFDAPSAYELDYSVEAMVKACAQVWGGEDMTQTPLLKKVLRSVFYALASKRLTLVEALALTNPEHADARRYLTSDLSNFVYAEQWQMFNALGLREFEERFGSANNRLMEFLASEIIRNIIGQQERVMDLRRAMDEGHIILMNLASGGRLSDDNARLLGALIVNDLFLKARRRLKGSRPFYVYIDECARYVNEDIARILDEARKMGLHLTLAHQHLSQLREASPAVYSAVMTNAQTKIVFGGLSVEDAEIMASTVFMGEYKLDEAKYSHDTYAVTDYVRTWLRHYSSTSGFSSGSSSGTSSSMSMSQADYEGAPVVSSAVWGRSEGSTRGYSESTSQGVSEAFQPVIRKQTLPGAFYSLEEQVYRSMALMVTQPTRDAIVKLPAERSCRVTTPEVRDAIPRDERVHALKERAHEANPFASRTDDVRKTLEERRHALFREAREVSRPKTPRKFRE